MFHKIFIYLTALPVIVMSLCLSAEASVEIWRSDAEPVVIEDVYLREGTSFVSIDELLLALDLEGQWDAVAHVYRIRTPHGKAIISPGSQFLKIGENFIPIAHRPRFIDGKLRVSETFILSQLAPLIAEPIHYRNLNPQAPVEAEDPFDRLFAFLLRKTDPAADGSKWIVSIDAGHGGADSGSLGIDGSKEKDVTIAVGHRLEKLLKMHQDAPVVMTRDGDYALSLEQRLKIVADGHADVLLSLHAGTFFTSDVSGVHLYIQPQTELDVPEGEYVENMSLKLAEIIKSDLQAKGFDVRGVRELPVYPLGRGDLPRVLVEMGNLSNTIDFTTLHDPIRQQDFARALFDGLQTFFDTNSGESDEPSQQ